MTRAQKLCSKNTIIECNLVANKMDRGEPRMRFVFHTAERLKSGVKAAAVCCLLSLAACAAKPGAMTAPLSGDQIISDTSPIKGAISVGTISGASDPDTKWKAVVSPADFKTALESSLALAALKANAAGKYTLNAKLVSL